MKKEDVDDFSYIEYLPLKNGNGIAVKIEFGDTPHYFAPIAFCEKNCKKVKSFRKDYLLISKEYSGSDPYIYNVKKFSLIKNIPGAMNAVWLTH
jgi:hypothetical protein